MAAKKKQVKKKKVAKSKATPEEAVPKKIQAAENKQAMWFFIIVAAIFIVFFSTYFITQSQKHFVYEGAEWWVEGEREGWGDMTLYHGVYPVVYGDTLYTNMNVWLRTDPRKNNIPSDIDFQARGIAANVTISFTTDLNDCPNRVLTTPLLSQVFGSGLPWTTVSGALANATRAQELDLAFADCSNATEDTTVLLIQKGDESKIFEDNGCYIMQYETCDDALPATEKMVLELIKQLNT